MKYTLLVNEGPYQRQSSDTALHFARAALSMGHEVVRVFFYHDGVANANALAVPPTDDRQLQNNWSELAIEHGVDLVVCVAAGLRRGVVESNLQAGFRISGIGQLVAASIESDRTLVFGD